MISPVAGSNPLAVRLLLVALPAFPLACGGQVVANDDPVGQSNAPILGLGSNPTIDTTFSAVAYVQTFEGACTGTLVAPQFVLTASHCVYRLAEGCATPPQEGATVFFAPAGTRSSATSFAVDAISVAPGAYDQSPGSCDQLAGTTTNCTNAQNPPDGGGPIPAANNVHVGHDMALMHLATPVPSTIAQPMPIVTSLTDNNNTQYTIHSAINLAAEFTGSAPTPPTPVIVGFGTQDEAGPGVSRLVGIADFLNLGSGWARACTPFISCSNVPNTHPRGSCPANQYADGEIAIGRTSSSPGAFDGPFVGGGDSGSPLLVLGGTGTTTGPDGIGTVTKLPGVVGVYVVMGVASKGGLRSGSDTVTTYAATFSPEIGPWLDQSLLDFDGDGVANISDNCPFTFNPTQENANFMTEQASANRGESTPIFGDVCDPVPVPQASADAVDSTTCVNCTSHRDLHSQFAMHTVGSSPISLTQGGVSPVVSFSPGFTGYPISSPNNPQTSVYFCQQAASKGFNCLSASVMSAFAMRFNKPPANSEIEDPTDPWHAMTIGTNARDTFIDFPLGLPTSALTWNYQADNAFWHRNAASPVVPDPDPSQYPGCNSGTGAAAGTCLDGVVWIDANSQVGTSITNVTTPSGGSAGVGAHVVRFSGGFETDLSGDIGSYYFANRPDALVSTVLPAGPFQVWPPAPACANCAVWWQLVPQAVPPGDPWSRLINETGRALPIIAASSSSNALALTTGGLVDVTPLVTPTLVGTLTGGSSQWISAAEGGPFIMDGLSAVRLSNDGTTIGDVAQFSGTTLELGSDDPDGFGVGTNVPPMPAARTNFQAVFSNAEHALYVIGGFSGHTLLPELWSHPIAGAWAQVPLVGTLGVPLAATYSLHDHSLWVLDQLKTTLHLLRIHPHAGTVEVIAQGSVPTRNDFAFLSAARDGNLLLSTNDACLNRHTITELSFLGPQLEASLLESGTGTLMAAPMPDAHSYSLVLRDGNGNLSLAHRDGLVPGSPTALQFPAVLSIGSSLGDLSTWTVTSGTKLSASPAVDSCSVLSVSAGNFTSIISPALSSLDIQSVAGGNLSQVSFALQPPPSPPNPFWTGNVQMYISAPSANVHNAFIGQVMLTGQPTETFSRETFTIPASAMPALTGNHTDVTLTIVLNVNQSTSPWLLTDLRFGQ